MFFFCDFLAGSLVSENKRKNHTRTRARAYTRAGARMYARNFFPKNSDQYKTLWHNWRYAVSGSLTASDPLAR